MKDYLRQLIGAIRAAKHFLLVDWPEDRENRAEVWRERKKRESG